VHAKNRQEFASRIRFFISSYNPNHHKILGYIHKGEIRLHVLHKAATFQAEYDEKLEDELNNPKLDFLIPRGDHKH
jgi:hypothetical protein